MHKCNNYTDVTSTAYFSRILNENVVYKPAIRILSGILPMNKYWKRSYEVTSFPFGFQFLSSYLSDIPRPCRSLLYPSSQNESPM